MCPRCVACSYAEEAREEDIRLLGLVVSFSLPSPKKYFISVFREAISLMKAWVLQPGLAPCLLVILFLFWIIPIFQMTTEALGPPFCFWSGRVCFFFF